MTAPKPNAELAYRVLDAIDADPKSWMQGSWIAETTCGTVACFAGTACLLSGLTGIRDEDDDLESEFLKDESGAWRYIPERAASLLGIKGDGGLITGYRLFEPENTRADLGRLVAEIFGPRPEPAQSFVERMQADQRAQGAP